MICTLPYKIIVLSIALIINQMTYAQPSSFSAKKTLYGVVFIAMTTALIKITYSLYNHFFWTHKNIVNHCRQLYKTIYATLQADKMLYFHISQLSDWDLKEAIFTQKNEAIHPFMAYHKTLCRAIYTLEQHLTDLLAEFETMALYKHQIQATSVPGAADIIETLTQLEKKGRLLHIQLEQAHSTMIVLKGRIALFKEYNDDYQYWIYEQERKRQGLLSEIMD